MKHLISWTSLYKWRWSLPPCMPSPYSSNINFCSASWAEYVFFSLCFSAGGSTFFFSSPSSVCAERRSQKSDSCLCFCAVIYIQLSEEEPRLFPRQPDLKISSRVRLWHISCLLTLCVCTWTLSSCRESVLGGFFFQHFSCFKAKTSAWKTSLLSTFISCW